MGVGDLTLLSNRAIRAEYASAVRAYVRPAWVDQICHFFTDIAGKARYPWIGGAMGMERRYGGDKVRKPMTKYIDLDTDEYVAGQEIPYKAMRADRTGVLARDIYMQELAKNIEEHWEELVGALIEAIETTDCYDGQYAVDTDHVDTGAAYTTAQDNDISVDISAYPSVKSGSTTKPSVEDIVWAAAETIRTMAAFRDDHGRFVNRTAKSYISFVPLTFWAAAIGASRTQLQGYGASSMLQAFLEDDGMTWRPIPLPWLTWTTKILTIRTDAVRKPIVCLEEPLEADIAMKISRPENSDYAREHELIKIVRRSNRTLKFGDWRTLCMATLA